MRRLISLSGAIVCALAPGGCSPSPVQPAGGERVRACLDELAAGRGGWAAFSVTYDDVHGLHGGLRLTVHGDGRVEQEAVRAPAGEPRRVPRVDLDRLVALLRELQVWEQQTPERAPAADESQARLTVRCGADEATIWEWYNDLRENRRIVRVYHLLTEIGWQPKAPQ